MIRIPPWGGVPRFAAPVGVGVLDDPVRRIVPLARCVEDAAPYGGAIPVGVGVLDDPVGRVVPLARCVGDAAPYGGIVP